MAGFLHRRENTPFVKSDWLRVTAFRAFGPKFAPVSTGEMSKVPSIVLCCANERLRNSLAWTTQLPNAFEWQPVYAPVATAYLPCSLR
jgi:hypothetical protein